VTRSALPDHLNDPNEIEASFPDDDENGKLIRWIKKKTKHWFAFGPRATEWYAKWREWPIVLFAVGGEGFWRFEDDNIDFPYYLLSTGSSVPNTYLSRIQYWKRWHIQVQWPLMIAGHFYTRKSDVPDFIGTRPNTDGKLWYFYLGAHRDGDKVYWFPSGFIGRNFK